MGAVKGFSTFFYRKFFKLPSTFSMSKLNLELKNNRKE